MDPFQILPGEIVVQILSNLSSLDLARHACRLNRRFRNLCKDISLQKRLEVRVGKYRKTMKIINRMKYVKELVVDADGDGVRVACKALKKCPNLREVTIEDSENVDPRPLFKIIGSHGKSLQVLKISARPCHNILDDIHHLSNLTRLYLRHVTKKELRAIVDNCKKLKCFHFPYGGGINPNYRYYNDDDLNYYLEGLKESLEEFSLGAIGLWFKEESMRNIKKCRRLRKVDLSMVDEIQLHRFTKHFPDDAEVGKALAPETLKSIFELPMLKVLKMEWHGLLSVKDFVGAFAGGSTGKSIEELSLSLSELLDDSVLGAITESCRESLTNLTLTPCDNVTDEGVARILQECTKLVTLKLDYACKVSSEAFRNVRAPLRSLEVECGRMYHECEAMRDEEVEAVKKRLGIDG